VASSRNKLREDVYFGILHLTQMSTERSQRQLADGIVISDGGVQYAISALITAGLVRLGNVSSSQVRRRYAYVLTPSGTTEKVALKRRLLKRKMKELDVLKFEIDMLGG
jgi:EPS-associated MarR family transcriptional regulator